MKRSIYLIIAFTISQEISGQQEKQLFFMHYLGESNFLNPAVQSKCNIFIGIPVLSSTYANYANSAFSYKSLVKPVGDGTYYADIDGVVSHLGRRSILDAELNTTLFALGIKRDNLYLAFSAIEKLTLPVTFPKDAASLLWKGNSQFEGTEASLRGTSSYLTYYREYALGISKKNEDDNFYGIKGKLLFGKLNLSMPTTNASLYTDPNLFNLNFNGGVTINMSAPVIINYANGKINSFAYNNSASISDLLLNRKNWGIAADFGFIHKYNEKIIISGSILDLGFIRWRSNLNNINISGHASYNGPLGNTNVTTTYFNDLINSLQDSMNVKITQKSYTTWLPSKEYLGATYVIDQKVSAGFLLSSVIYRTKLVTAGTIMGDYNVFGSLHAVFSYSLMYRSFNNFGFGLSIGQGPIQFYAISDNIAGIIWPLSARNINLRFGLNINLGCGAKNDNQKAQRSSAPEVSCPCYRQDVIHDQRKAVWNKNK